MNNKMPILLSGINNDVKDLKNAYNITKCTLQNNISDNQKTKYDGVYNLFTDTPIERLFIVDGVIYIATPLLMPPTFSNDIPMAYIKIRKSSTSDVYSVNSPIVGRTTTLNNLKVKSISAYETFTRFCNYSVDVVNQVMRRTGSNLNAKSDLPFLVAVYDFYTMSYSLTEERSRYSWFATAHKLVQQLNFVAPREREIAPQHETTQYQVIRQRIERDYHG